MSADCRRAMTPVHSSAEEQDPLFDNCRGRPSYRLSKLGNGIGQLVPGSASPLVQNLKKTALQLMDAL